MADHQWYLVSYDVRDPERLRRAARLILGYGLRIQYSVYRCRLDKRTVERLKWELARLLAPEDSILVIGLCASCVSRIGQRGNTITWDDEQPSFDIVD